MKIIIPQDERETPFPPTLEESVNIRRRRSDKVGKCQWLAPRLAILQSDLKISQLVRRISEPLTDPNGLYKAFSSIGLIPFSGVFFHSKGSVVSDFDTTKVASD